MDNKKKHYLEWFLKLQFVLSFFMVLSICLNFGSEVQAITQDDILSALTQFKNNYPTNGRRYDDVMECLGNNLVGLSSDIYNHYLSQSFVTVSNQNVLSLYVSVPLSGDIGFNIASSRLLEDRKICKNDRNLSVMRSSDGFITTYNFLIKNGEIISEENNTRLYYCSGGSRYDFLMLFPINNVYDNYLSSTPSNLNDLYDIFFGSNGELVALFSNFTDPNSITINAQNVIKYKAHIDNQATISVSGEWNINEFNYYIQRKENGIYHTLSDECDYSLINNNEYNNAYLYCKNINYLSYGTYRFVAISEVLGLSAFSNDFVLTYENIGSSGSASGTVGDNNLNVDINIDNGNVVDNVKDFFGGQPDFDNVKISQEDLENSINIEPSVSPYDNFVIIFINGLIDSLTSPSSKDFTFKVHTWGDTYNVKTTDIIPAYGEELSNVLRTFSIIAFGFVLIKWSTKIIEALNVADASKALELVEEKYSNLL